MQDQDAPPVEEGETGGGVDAVLEAAIRTAVPIATSATAFTQRRWITATVLRWPATITTALAPDGSGQGSLPIIRRPNQNHCRCVKMPRQESSASSTTFSSRPKFRRPRA